MNKLLLPLVAVAAVVGMCLLSNPDACAKGSKTEKSPVLLTVAGKPVTLDEFEYLYHKNNSQQLAPQTVDEYLDMFITYKQKVAAAEAAGIDQTQAFLKEFDGYRRELAEPYLTDTAVEDSILRTLYQRTLADRDVWHIMVPLNTPAKNGEAQRAFLDSLRTAIVDGGADFSAVARQYSSDPAAARNGGHMGWLPVGRTPYTFEDAAYQTAVGEISPVIATPFGYHIVKPQAERPARGQVLVEHILKLTKGLLAEEAAKKKAEIDSIYALVSAPGADFEAVAKAESEDPGSAASGGKLPWFGVGQMVPEFEQISYALDSGAVSQPFATSYGYHIVHKLGSKTVESYEQALPTLKKMISGDVRGQMGKQRRIEQLERQFGAKKYPEVLEPFAQQVRAAGGADSTLLASLAASDVVLAQVGDHQITLAEAFSDFSPAANSPVADVLAQMDRAAQKAYTDVLLEDARENLAVNNADYRNLLNEYRDGILLFEISDREIWGRAKQEPQAVEDFFQQNRSNYTWAKPKFKGFVVFATNDSVMLLAKQYLDAHPSLPSDSVSLLMRRQFGKNVRVDHVLASEGENPIVDYLAFSGKCPDKQKLHWKDFFTYQGRVISAPEEVADERGTITTDFQNALEQQWLTQLKTLYPAKVNKKTLKKAK